MAEEALNSDTLPTEETITASAPAQEEPARTEPDAPSGNFTAPVDGTGADTSADQ